MIPLEATPDYRPLLIWTINKQAKDTTEKGLGQESHSTLKITNVSLFAPVTNQKTLFSSSCTFAEPPIQLVIIINYGCAFVLFY